MRVRSRTACNRAPSSLLASPLTLVSTTVVTSCPLFSALFVTVADRRRHLRRCPPFPLSFSFRPPPASPPSSSSSSLSSTVVVLLSDEAIALASIASVLLPYSLSPSLLLDPPSASLHSVFHRRSPPRSPPLSTVGHLPLLPLCCALFIIIADHRRHRPPLRRCSPWPPLLLPLHLLLRFRLCPSTPVTTIERHRRPLAPSSPCRRRLPSSFLPSFPRPSPATSTAIADRRAERPPPSSPPPFPSSLPRPHFVADYLLQVQRRPSSLPLSRHPSSLLPPPSLPFLFPVVVSLPPLLTTVATSLPSIVVVLRWCRPSLRR